MQGAPNAATQSCREKEQEIWLQAKQQYSQQQ
jgi:hypothetical protein